MGTVETYKSTTPRIVSGQPVPTQHPWQDRDLRDFREREREREPHRPQISDFGCSEFRIFGDAKTQLWHSLIPFDLPIHEIWPVASCKPQGSRLGDSTNTEAWASWTTLPWEGGELRRFPRFECTASLDVTRRFTCNGRPIHLTTEEHPSKSALLDSLLCHEMPKP